MLDRHLEPDDLPPAKPIYYDIDFLEEPSEEELRIAEYNYECLVYNEPEKRIWRRL